jgi:VanZ family protein
LISSHPVVGSVSDEGVVTIRDFIGLEEQNITFTIYANGNFNVFDSVDVRIQKVFPEMISISHITSIEAGKTLVIAPTFSPIDVTDQQLDFVSSHPDIAVVSTKGSTGTIFAKSIGQTTITATSRMDGDIHTIFTINVVAPTLITENVIDAIHLFVRKGIGHVGLNFFNGILGFFTFYAFLSNRKSQYMTLSILTGIFLGFTFESLQFFAPGRSPEWLDGVYNTIGYLGAQGLLFLFMGILQRNQGKKKQPKKS